MSNVSNFAMFRLNLWTKPFLGVAPQGSSGGRGMDSSSFVPNPLTSPALMVLASTSDSGHDTNRLSSSHHFSGQNVDKDPTPGGSFSGSSFMYRPGEPFAPPLYAPLPPYVQSNHLDRGVSIINSGGGSAFRPVASSTECGVDEYQSAFLPTKKSKQEENSPLSTLYNHCNNERLVEQANFGHSREEKSSHTTVKEERPSSLCSGSCDTNSESHSESGDHTERATPDEGRNLRKQRRRNVLDGQTPCCPICGLTLRAGEFEAHLSLEIEKIEKLSRINRRSRESTLQNRKNLLCPNPLGRKGKDSPTIEAASQQRYETYQRIKCNRQSRLSSRSRNKKKRPEEAVCPICNEKLSGTAQELNEHAELCLKKKEQITEDDHVDVEGDDSGEQYEEYTWAGQTRIRATTMLQGGFAGSGFQLSSSRLSVDDDIDLNVDGDDSEQYGKPQYSEVDIIPCSADEPEEDRERQALRGAMLGTTIGSMVELPNSTESGDHKFEPEPSCYQAVDQGSHNLDPRNATNSSQRIISALKCRLREKEEDKTEEKHKCLICMESYKVPLTSVQCWHVHCEQCWLRTLGAKKLCPQCNMITSPSDLRRIFL
ncbi:E3 ubiquitin-protein ligase Rnf220 isoform X1 [Argonauta hians]